MGWVAAAGSIILEVVTTVGAIIAVIVVEVVTAALTVVSAIGKFAAIVSMAIVKTTISLLTLNLQGVVANMSVMMTELGGLWVGTIHQLHLSIQAISSSWNALMTVINFQTLKRIHTIGLLVSKEYRKLISKFWLGVSEVSTAIGMAADTLPLVLRMTEQSQQMFSALMGRSYEVGKLDWIKSIQNWEGWDGLVHGNRSLPLAELFEWLDSVDTTALASPGITEEQIKEMVKEGVVPPAMAYAQLAEIKDFELGLTPDIFNGIANFQKVLVSELDGIIGVTDGLVENYMELHKTVEDIQKTIPKDWGEKLEEFIGPVTQKVDHFIAYDYDPTVRHLQAMIDIEKHKVLVNEARIGGLVEDMAHPGKHMSNIDKLSDLERMEEEDMIAEISNRSIQRETTPITEEIESVHKDIPDRFDSVTTVEPVPEYHVREKEGITFKPGEEPEKGKTWFVGDY